MASRRCARWRGMKASRSCSRAICHRASCASRVIVRMYVLLRRRARPHYPTPQHETSRLLKNVCGCARDVLSALNWVTEMRPLRAPVNHHVNISMFHNAHVFQPRGAGSGWWNLYLEQPSSAAAGAPVAIRALAPMAVECAVRVSLTLSNSYTS